MSESCSSQSASIGEPIAGTAPEAQAWVVIEQPGPWGRQALLDSHLDPTLGRLLVEAAAGTGTTILLARHPDRLERSGAAEGPGGLVRNVWVAHTAPGDTRMRHGVTSDIDAIVTWDFAALAQGILPAFGTATREPVLFICTHSGRDQCCAIGGRALLTATLDGLDQHDRATVWESSHIGGHRFAPTALSLPAGTVFGRLSPGDIDRIRADESARIVAPANVRGRSAFPQPLQAAEIAVRVAADVIDRDVLDVLWVRDGRAMPVRPGHPTPTATALLAEVRHVDGRAWHVSLRRHELAATRAESCGGEQASAHAWRAEGVSACRPWA